MLYLDYSRYLSLHRPEALRWLSTYIIKTGNILNQAEIVAVIVFILAEKTQDGNAISSADYASRDQAD